MAVGLKASEYGVLGKGTLKSEAMAQTPAKGEATLVGVAGTWLANRGFAGS